jgi:hypothetical protein
MKLAMTAILPASGFNDEHLCMKCVKPLLSSMRKQMRESTPMKGEFRISILVQAIDGREQDKVGEAVRASCNG